ncbi:MAG: DUF805 domain-containing protein [Maritimibacter sp.]
MTLQESVKNAFSIYDHIFAGRASRSEFWKPMLAIIILLVAILIFFGLFSSIFTVIGTGFLTGLFASALMLFGLALYAMTIALSIPLFVLGMRRLHDTDRSAWWYLIALVPIVGPIILIVFYAQKGTDGPNRFGDDPLNGSGGSGLSGAPHEGFSPSSIPGVDRG